MINRYKPNEKDSEGHPIRSEFWNDNGPTSSRKSFNKHFTVYRLVDDGVNPIHGQKDYYKNEKISKTTTDTSIAFYVDNEQGKIVSYLVCMEILGPTKHSYDTDMAYRKMKHSGDPIMEYQDYLTDFRTYDYKSKYYKAEWMPYCHQDADKQIWGDPDAKQKIRDLIKDKTKIEISIMDLRDAMATVTSRADAYNDSKHIFIEACWTLIEKITWYSVGMCVLLFFIGVYQY